MIGRFRIHVCSCLYVFLDSMGVSELVVLIEDSFDKSSTDELLGGMLFFWNGKRIHQT